MNFRYTPLLLLLAVLGGCGDANTPSNDQANASDTQQAQAAKESVQEDTEDTPSDSSWTITNETDPMTDVSVTKAERIFVTPKDAQVVVTVTCGVAADGEKNKGVYEITAYDEFGEGKVFAQRVATTTLGNASVVTDFLVRADKEEPVKGLFPIEYQNQFKFSQLNVSPSDKDVWIQDRQECFEQKTITNRVKANSIIVSLPFNDGEEYLEIDQTDQKFREFSNQCRYEDTGLTAKYYHSLAKVEYVYGAPCDERLHQLDSLPAGVVQNGESDFYLP